MVLRKNWISTAIIIFCKKKEMLVIKDAKFKFERNKIEKSSKDPKKLWEIINNKLGKTKKANKTINYIYANKNKIVNKEDQKYQATKQCLRETDYKKHKDNIYTIY